MDAFLRDKKVPPPAPWATYRPGIPDLPLNNAGNIALNPQVTSRGAGTNYPREREKGGPGTTVALKIRAAIGPRELTSHGSGEATPCPESGAIFVRNGSI